MISIHGVFKDFDGPETSFEGEMRGSKPYSGTGTHMGIDRKRFYVTYTNGVINSVGDVKPQTATLLSGSSAQTPAAATTKADDDFVLV